MFGETQSDEARAVAVAADPADEQHLAQREDDHPDDGPADDQQHARPGRHGAVQVTAAGDPA